MSHELKKMLAEQFKIEIELTDFVKLCLKRIYGEYSARVLYEFECNLSNLEECGGIDTLEHFDKVSREQRECVEKYNKRLADEAKKDV